MWYTVPIFIFFELIGFYTLVLKDNITRRDYILVWFTLMICILALANK